MGGLELATRSIDSVLYKNILHIQQVAPIDLASFRSPLELPLILDHLTTIDFPSDSNHDAFFSLWSTLTSFVSSIALKCPFCHHWHLNHGWNSLHLHNTHYCSSYNTTFSSPMPAVGNPLAFLSLSLIPYPFRSSHISLILPSFSATFPHHLWTAIFDGMELLIQ